MARSSFLGLLGLLAGCGGGLMRPGGAPPPPVPDEVRRIGEIELVTHTRAQRGGDASGFAWMAVRHWSLRWNGQPVTIDSRGGLFGTDAVRTGHVNAVFELPRAGAATAPDLLVNVGDPNNTSAFHLVYSEAGQLHTPLVCVATGGDNGVAAGQRLLAAEPEAERAAGPLLGPMHRRIDSARPLLLGRRCLLDPATRSARPVPELPDEVSMNSRTGPSIVSPDGLSLLRLGSLRVRQGEGPPIETLQLLAADLQAGRWQLLPIERQRMRHARAQDIDAGWIAHHFEWRRGKDGRERIAERRGFRALPHRGWLSPDAAEYRLEGVRPGQRARLIDFLQRQFQAEAVATPATSHSSFSTGLRLSSENVHVTDHGFFVMPAASYFPGQPGDPALQRALIQRIGAAFDAELASGRFDDLFVGAADRPANGAAPGPARPR